MGRTADQAVRFLCFFMMLRHTQQIVDILFGMGKDDELRSLRARLKEKQEKIAIMEAQMPEKAKIKQFPDVREP